MSARGRTLAALLIGVVLAVACARPGGAAEVLPLPEVTRTAESRFVHRIALLDEKGNALGPASGVPYSPKATCTSSRCHDYETACKGTHTRIWPSAQVPKHRADAHVWTLFDGTTNVAAPISHGFLPAKPDAFDPKVHLTAFNLAVQFGAFHPGGGRLELDEGGRRYDEHLAANPALRAATDPSPSPSYYEARWVQTGVLENDCLACHALHGYDHVERAGQIASMNLRWAATVGAGFGTVEGKTASLPPPKPDAKPDESAGPAIKVKYNPALFSPEGKVHIELGKPPDANCLFCHRRPTREKAAWWDCLDADVHSKAGLRCVDCHRAGADHVMAGDPAAARTEFASLTCLGCHTAGRLGAPVPEHEGLPRLHLDKLSCETCHSGPRPQLAPIALEQPTDPTWGVILNSKKPSGPAVYAPIYARDDTGKLQLHARMLPAYYANRAEDGHLAPLDPQYVTSRFRRAASEIKDDTRDGLPEVNTDAEIKAMLGALKKKGVSPVYLVGGRAYELDEKGELKNAATPLADPLDRPLAHNVRPGPQSLGASGCTECHRSKAPFFLSLGITRAVDAAGKPVGKELYARLDKSGLDLRLGSLRERYIRPYGPVAIALVVLVIALHYVLFGPRRYDRAVPEELVQRFGWLERLTHLGLLGSFLVLACTGLSIAAGVERVLGASVTRLHTAASWLLIGSALVAFLLWARDMLLSKLDVGWVKVLGGYLGYKGHVPAGRFNAGQKMFFWFILLVVLCLAVTGLVMMASSGYERWLPLAYTLHTLCSYLMIICIIAHAYLGSLANPGTLGSVFNGKVARTWLEHHHPDYKPRE